MNRVQICRNYLHKDTIVSVVHKTHRVDGRTVNVHWRWRVQIPDRPDTTASKSYASIAVLSWYYDDVYNGNSLHASP